MGVLSDACPLAVSLSLSPSTTRSSGPPIGVSASFFFDFADFLIKSSWRKCNLALCRTPFDTVFGLSTSSKNGFLHFLSCTLVLYTFANRLNPNAKVALYFSLLIHNGYFMHKWNAVQKIAQVDKRSENVELHIFL